MLNNVDFSRWHVDIDKYLNPLIPRPPWRWLPRPISHFLGYRGDKPPKNLGNLVIVFWTLIGVFCGVLVVAEVTMHVPSFQNHHAPIIVASFGAAAVLEFSAIDSPFAQPRSAVLSQVIASTIGIGIGRLFALSPHAESLPQVGGALACAITTAVMVLTKTIHPPAGATALLAVTEGYEIGWFLILIMFLGSIMMQAVALVINNIQRRFPVYWWTPEPLSRPEVVVEDIESTRERKQESLAPSASDDDTQATPPMHIILERGRVTVPDNLWITAEEMEFLEQISLRIR
ncbi:HPP family-domain-containing protein [Aspergillus bertholletiae]|uniref:HPP family-domain-containing protein n=1 Tax=Aspergillus bertholletiae TaxID=1226010 RepID=A0A5N7BNQ9_9EURO|nr:HPP family-domain-containing protein [Aspergillus bertholletiae]